MQTKKKFKYKQLLTQVVAFTLALIMCISPLSYISEESASHEHILHAHAAQDSANNSQIDTGSNKTTGKSTMASVTWGDGDSNKQQGFRMYIVNENLERISKVYDFVYRTPPKSTIDRTTRFDTSISPETAPGENIYLIDVLKAWCGVSQNTQVPYPTVKVGSQRKPNGQAFKDWFFGGQAGSTIFTGVVSPDGTITPSGGFPDKDNDGYASNVDPDDLNPTIPDASKSAPGIRYCYCEYGLMCNCPECGGSGACIVCDACFCVGAEGDVCGYCNNTYINCVCKCEICGKYERDCGGHTTCSWCGGVLGDSCWCNEICYGCGLRYQQCTCRCDICKQNMYFCRCICIGCSKLKRFCKCEPCTHCGKTFCTCDVACMVCYKPGYLCECVICDECGFNEKFCQCELNKNKALNELNSRTGITFAYIPISSDPDVQAQIDLLIDRLEKNKWRFWKSDNARIDHAYEKEYNIYLKDVKKNAEKIIDLASAKNIIVNAFNGVGVNPAGDYNFDPYLQNASKINLDELNQNIPLGGNSPVYNLVTSKDTIKVPGYDYSGLALQQGGYLVVENITWMKPFLGGQWNEPRNYTSLPVYGSVWNIMQYQNDTRWGNWSTILPVQQIPALATKVQVTTNTGKSIYPVTSYRDTISPGEVKAYYNGYAGLSMHIYDANQVYEGHEGEVVIETSSSTSTYDETLGRNPGPAPDDSAQLTDEQKNDTSEYGNIVKFYEDGSGDDLIRTSYTRTKTPREIKIESEPEYVIKDWYTSSTFRSASGDKEYASYKSSMSNNQTGTQPKKITLGDGETTLYVLLVRSAVSANSDYTIHESEIAKPINTDMDTIKVPVALHSLEDECEGHCRHIEDNCNSCDYDYSDCSHDDCDDCLGYDANGNSLGCGHNSHNESCKDYFCSHKRDNCTGKSGCIVYCGDNNGWNLTDSSLSFKFKNIKLSNYPNIIASASGYTAKSVPTINMTRVDTKEDFMDVDGFEFEFIAYRGSDNLNYAKYKNDISNFGFTNANTKLNKTRRSTDYSEQIIVDLKDNGSELITKSKGRYGCTDEDEASTPSPFLNYNINITVETYSGSERSIDRSINMNPKLTIGTSGTTRRMGRMISTDTLIKFNPYIQMTYAGYSGSKTNVAVLSEYNRGILPNDYAEIGWVLVDENLLIQSQMWATDSMFTNPADTEEWTGLNQVLKGGATLQLKDKNKQQVVVATYQTIVEGDARGISTITGPYQLTRAEAETYHDEFVDKAIQTFDNAELIQYVSTVIDGTPAFEVGIPVGRGGDIRDLNNGSTTSSTESKYYLEKDVNDTTNVQRNDLDVAKKSTEKASYRFYSNVKGEIWMEKTDYSGNVSNVRLLTKNQTVLDLTNDDAKNINAKTYAVTKLLAAIERNTGNDATADWVSDGHWYNEAYAGITVYMQKTTLEVGLSVGINPLRTMVLDPKLIPQVTSKSEQGTTAFSSAFKTNLSENTPIAQFKGNDIFMMEPDLLFNTRNIYITNMTVDDTK